MLPQDALEGIFSGKLKSEMGKCEWTVNYMKIIL